MPNQKSSRRRYLTIIGAGAITGLAGCVGGSDGEGGNESSNDGDGETSETEGGHIRVGMGRTITTLSPVMMGSKFTERWGVKMFYSTLTRLTSNLELYGDLATDWSANDTADEWTFTLRDDATFHHNGETVTASDVAATFGTIYNEDVGSPGAGTMGEIDSVEAVDETTVRFTLAGANADFPKLVAKGWGGIVPEEIVTDPDRRQELGSQEFGSGPFELDSFESGASVTGVAYDDYYRSDDQGDLPHAAQVTARTIPEASSLTTALENNEIDIIWEPPTDQWTALQEADGVETQKVPAGNIVNFIMDTSVEPWSDERVREAVKHAIDRQGVIESALGGLGQEGQDSPIAPTYEFYQDIEGRPPERDLERAQELLADAGYPDGFDLEEDFGLTFFSASDPPERLDSAIVIQSQLKEIGITFDIEQISYDRYINDVWTKAPTYMGAYGMRISGPNFMKLLLHSEGGWNGESSYSNSDFDEAIDNAIQSTDPETRSQAMAEAQEIIATDGPYAVPYYDDEIGAHADYVEGYQTSPLTYLFYPDEFRLTEDAPTR